MTPSIGEIDATVTDVVRGITKDWGIAANFVRDTRLAADLGFTSMDTIDLFATLEMRFKRKFPYESFIVVEGGGYRPDLSIGELADFVHAHFDTGRPDPSAV
jgi:acyl carrier protein